MFHHLVSVDRQQHRDRDFFPLAPPTFLRIRRNHVIEDGVEGLAQLGGSASSWKTRVRVQFVSEHGLEEAGIDGGGLFKGERGGVGSLEGDECSRCPCWLDSLHCRHC